MSLKTLVKVSEVNNLSDARYCAGMGVEMLGFTLDENHPKFIELAKLREISVWISGVKVVGEFTGDNIENINYLSEELNLDYIQISHPVSIDKTKHLKKPVILKLAVDLYSNNEVENILEEYKNHTSYFLLESEKEDSIIPFKEFLKKWTLKYPLLIGFGINNITINQILEELHPSGIALKGGNEIKPGLKSFDELSSILEVLEVND